MSAEPSLVPYGTPEPEGFGGAHLSDYWNVVTRRLWLVLLVFTVTTAAAIWAIARQSIFYQGTMSLQVNDPLERQRGLVAGARMSGMDIFVDPIQSEIQVLTSASIKTVVVDSLGMRLRPASPELVRSELFGEAYVAPEVPDGRYRLVYEAAGRRAQLQGFDGTVLGTSEVGARLEGGGIRFTVQPPPAEERVYEIDVLSRTAAASEISLSATPRESTNIIDVQLVHPDPVLTPLILNRAAAALRERGAERVRASANADVDFIQVQLDSAEATLRSSIDRIREFKRTQAFTSLSTREQRLVNQSEALNEEIEGWNRQRRVLGELVRTLESEGPAATDLGSVLSELPQGSNPQIRSLVEAIRTRQTEERRLLSEDRLGANHPSVVATRAEIAELGRQLAGAAGSGLRAIEDRLNDLTRRQSELRTQLTEFPDLESRLEELEAQSSLDRESFQFLMSQLYQARITQAAASPYVEVLDPATGAFRIQTRERVNILLGALLGLILGVGAAFFLEYLDRTVRTSSDVEMLLGIPVLGVIPRLRLLEGSEAHAGAGGGVPLVVAMDPLDPAAEAYRNLRVNLMFMATEEAPIRSVLFSSPGPSEGKSTTAVNFAVMLAQQGQRVLLVDADLRRPSLHRALDVLREPGLTNLLIGDAELRETVRPSVLPNLDFLPSGPFPPNPSELLSSRQTVRLLEDLSGRYEQIVIDSPPVLAVTDAAVLAAHTDGVVLVLRSGETEQRAAERSVDQLRRLGVRVFGAALNEVSAATPDESHYLQYYYAYQSAGSGGWQRLREGLSRVKFLG